MLQWFKHDDKLLASLVEELIHNREDSERSDAPIIFIGHSLGGTLLKQIYVVTHKDRESGRGFQSLHEYIRAYIFLATPQNTIVFEDIGALFRTLDRDSPFALGGNENDLEEALMITDRINDDFRRLDGEELPASCFHERLTSMIGLQQVRIPLLFKYSNFPLTVEQQSILVSRVKALYSSRQIHNSQLDRKHQDMAKLGPIQDDVSTRRFMAGVENTFKIIESPDVDRTQMSDGRIPKRGLNLLCLDGGGVKGLFSLMVLEKILDEVELRSYPPRPGRLPCEYFDLIGGTSTGGLIAIMLGRLQMDIKTCIKTYCTLSETIFASPGGVMSMVNSTRQIIGTIMNVPWYSGETLKEAICATIDGKLDPQEKGEMDSLGLTAKDVRLVSPRAQISRCMVCAICEGQHQAARIRSYLPRKRGNRDTSSYKIWEAARATSAAPIYFPAIEIGNNRYFDGGLNCNNPVLEVVDEAKDEFPGSPIDTIISVGTGQGQIVEPHGGVVNLFYAALHRLTNTEAQHEEFMRRDEFKDLELSYFRFQGQHNLGVIDLAAVNKMDEIASIAKHYLEGEEVKGNIVRCAQRILRSRRF